MSSREPALSCRRFLQGSAALAAGSSPHSPAGAKVSIIEKAPFAGGTAMKSVGGITAKGERP